MSEQKLEVFNVLNFLDNGYELEDLLEKEDELQKTVSFFLNLNCLII